MEKFNEIKKGGNRENGEKCWNRTEEGRMKELKRNMREKLLQRIEGGYQEGKRQRTEGRENSEEKEERNTKR